MGNTYGGHLVYDVIRHKIPIPFVKRDEDLTVKTPNNEIIQAVVVNDLEGHGESYMTEGGVGQREVTIHLEGKRGHGYKFLVDVYAI